MHNKVENEIVFEEVRFCYGNVCALHGVSFALCSGSLTALIGPNGGGKSTLIKLLAGLLKPDEGTVWRDKDAKVSYVPQDTEFDTAFPLTVRELVLMGTLKSQISPFHSYNTLQKQTASKAIERVGLSEFEHRGIGQLSGGQLKRAVIARALASDAAIIALDEPDASLDIDVARELYSMLNALKGEKTILISSHHVDTVLNLADVALYVNKQVTVFADPLELKKKLKGGLVL